MSDLSLYEKYGLKQVINASGKMTILGVSTLSEEVVQDMKKGASNFFEIKDLLDKTGAYIAKTLNVESAYIVSSASAGIALSVASLISKDNLDIIYNLHSRKYDVPREIILPKGHNVDYGCPVETMIELGGGLLREAGYSNQCKKEHTEALINENTLALMYVKSHHCVQKGMVEIKELVDLGEKYNLPVIIDAAAEEDLKKYYNLGADVVIYSGAKAIEGPTSGLVIGKKKYIDLIKLQSQGIGRAMKVGKENILGLTRAIELYENSIKTTGEELNKRLEGFINTLNKINGVEAKSVKDDSGRDIVRCELSFNSEVLNLNAKYIANELKEGAIAIYTRDYRANQGKIEIDIRSVSDEELKIIEHRIIEIIGGK
ncbi:DgaE family pyridoxal phosphate-dependent ammonia lyase [Clostridium amazonitimonense]|uniref:DgaE family pyridoxal phosphate-dependent ammonia lyase n=1 Tax=Clostridium amazonitimonense TaxID=1499689 RepID=UPI000509F95D|nr:DgaE family pyridoxal phosphate-dependent ammonia lyase [Clostridium amazonitimonense]